MERTQAKSTGEQIRHVLGFVTKDIKSPVSCDNVFVCSTTVIDRDSEIIEQSGWELKNFQLNPVMLTSHQHKLPSGKSSVIGSWPWIAAQDKVVMADGQVGQALVGGASFAWDTELGKEHGNLYKAGHMRAVSVGFRPVDGEWRTIEGKRIYVHTKQELYEISAVAVGSNPLALATLSAKFDGVARGNELAEKIEKVAADLADIKSSIVNMQSTRDQDAAFIIDHLSEIQEILELSSDTLGQAAPLEGPEADETAGRADDGEDGANTDPDPSGSEKVRSAAKALLESTQS